MVSSGADATVDEKKRSLAAGGRIPGPQAISKELHRGRIDEQEAIPQLQVVIQRCYETRFGGARRWLDLHETSAYEPASAREISAPNQKA